MITMLQRQALSEMPFPFFFNEILTYIPWDLDCKPNNILIRYHLNQKLYFGVAVILFLYLSLFTDKIFKRDKVFLFCGLDMLMLMGIF